MIIKQEGHFSALDALLISRMLFKNGIAARKELSLSKFWPGNDESTSG